MQKTTRLSTADNNDGIISRDRSTLKLEQEFEAAYHDKNKRSQRSGLFCIILVMIVSVGFYWDDKQIFAETVVHCSTLIPLIFLYRSTERSWFQSHSQYCLSGLTIYVGMVIIALEPLDPTPHGAPASQTTAILILVIMGSVILLRLRFLYTSFCCFIVCLSYVVAVYAVFHLTQAFWNVSMVLIAGLLVSIGANLMEQSARNEFRLNQQLNELAEDRLHTARTAEHEIKNKLVAIGTPIRLALKYFDSSNGGGNDDQNSKPCLRHLTRALREISELEKLLHKQLNIQRMEAGILPSLDVPQSVRMAEVVQHVCDKKREELRLYREADSLKVFPEIRVETSLSPTSVLLCVGEIEQVLENLLGNAINYSPNGGTISVFTSETNEKLFVRITDEGIGILPDKLDGLFDRPYERGRAEEYHIIGMGIGLHVIKKLIDSMEGTIRIDSKGPDRGTTAYIELPRNSA